MVILENIDIDIDKAILQNIDMDKISNRFKFGISNRATANTAKQLWNKKETRLNGYVPLWASEHNTGWMSVGLVIPLRLFCLLEHLRS